MNRRDNISLQLNQAIKHQKCFVAYRVPGETSIHYLEAEEEAIETIGSMAELNNRSGYIIAPFSSSSSEPIVCIHAEEVLFEIPEMPNRLSSRSKDKDSGITPEYCERFAVFMQAIRSGAFHKLVLSRNQQVSRPEDFSPTEAFLKACNRYIRSYTYLFYTPQTGMWLGGTPEILLAGEKHDFMTVALAGTLPLHNGTLPSEWDAKNKEEQEVVADYIRKRLSSLNLTVSEKAVQSVQAGSLAHLKSEFRFSLPHPNALGDLLQLLHPTPAVCGMPEKEAYSFILENEGYNRKYYSGFLGQLNPEGKSVLYVNLRCMNISDRELTLYAGSGLLASSSASEEWNETEDKLWTMLSIIP